MNKGILFDLDGTLWDSSAQVTAAWNDCLCNQAHRPERITVDDMHRFMGKTMDVIAGMMLPTLPQDEQRRIMGLCGDHERKFLLTHPAHIYEQEKELLTALAKTCKLAVVSNCQEGYIEIFLQQCGFSELFCDYESAGHTGLSKGKNIRLVMERQGITDCIYVGDTQGDADAAKEAGVPFIHAAYGFGQPDACDAAISSLSELEAAANGIFNR